MTWWALSLRTGLKGGPLLSMLHSFSHHGDPSVRLLVKQLLTHAYRPMNTILGKWLFEGQLSDAFHEVGRWECVCASGCLKGSLVMPFTRWVGGSVCVQVVV